MNPLVSTLTAIALLSAGAASAADAGVKTDGSMSLVLPEDHLARAALDASPDVERAKAHARYATATARQLAVGEHEFVVTGAVLDRRVRGEGDYPEFSVDLSRAVRLPGKGVLDRRIGVLGEKAAEDGIDDAIHQAGLRLADAWFTWVEASNQTVLDASTVTLARRDVEALRRRVELKDASLLDLEQAQAVLATAISRHAQAQGALEAARLSLSRGFPELPMPAAPPLVPDPPVLDRPPAEWRGVVVENSHEIRIADYLAQQADARAERARRDRRPDPTVGVRAFSERGGLERGIGVLVSTPLGGARRSAAADGEAALAAAARADLYRVRRQVDELAAKDVAAVISAQSAWVSAAAALDASRAAAGRVRRGFELAELDLADVLVAERSVYEARRVEIAARTSAWRAAVRLRIDAHVLWAGEDEND